MLPTFLIIGAMKSGTTSLYAYLKEHPEIGMPYNKEPDFFSNESCWTKGLTWYEGLFDGFKNKTARGEASVNYTKFPYYKDVPERICSIIPQVKLIYVLRSPVERTYSHYVHNVFAGIEAESFENAIRNKPLYIQASLYYSQIEQYLKYFPRENMLIFLLDDLKNYPLATVQKVFAFLGVNSGFVPEGISEVRHQGAAKRGQDNLFMKLLRKSPFYHIAVAVLPDSLKDLFACLLKKKICRPAPMSDAMHNQLLQMLSADIDKLSSFLDRDLSVWTAPKM